MGKFCERDLTFEDWKSLLRDAVKAQFDAITPCGSCAITIVDLHSFEDDTLPKFQADVVSAKRSSVTREDVLRAGALPTEFNRKQLAALLGCGEQTVQRRLEHNNVRGGKQAVHADPS